MVHDSDNTNKIQPLGTLLLNRWYINKHQLEEALRIQEDTKENIWSILSWKWWVTSDIVNKMVTYAWWNVRIWEYLIEKGIITHEVRDQILAEQNHLRNRWVEVKPFLELLKEKNILSDSQFLMALSKFMWIEYLDISKDDFSVIDYSILSHLKNIDKNYLLSNNILPIFYLKDSFSKEKWPSVKGTLSIVTSRPQNTSVFEDLWNTLNCKVQAYISDEESVKKWIERLYEVRQNKEIENRESINYLNKLIYLAILRWASDIHIEPNDKWALIRFRTQWDLHLLEFIEKQSFDTLLNVIKIQSNIETSKKFIPQDGSFNRAMWWHVIDVRVNTIPNVHWQKVVMRILNQAMSNADICSSNLPARIESNLVNIMNKRKGMILVTWPTWTWKTTTLHRLLKYIASSKLNIQTIEDPVEYRVWDYINQSSVNTSQGYWYTEAIDAILRQDPDVLMIWEIRNLKTASVVSEVALTWHFILSSLHTNDSIWAITRLIDLKVSDSLFSVIDITILNQRLVRKLCNCAERLDKLPSQEHLSCLWLSWEVIGDLYTNFDRYMIKKPKWCSSCDGEGYLWMQVIIEQFELNREIKEMILSSQSYDSILDTIRDKYSMNMLFEEAFRQVINWVTSFDELAKVPRWNYKMRKPSEIIQNANISGVESKYNVEQRSFRKEKWLPDLIDSIDKMTESLSWQNNQRIERLERLFSHLVKNAIKTSKD